MAKRKLLGFIKNLIICIVLGFIINIIFANTTFAAYKFADQMKETVAAWYRVIRNVCIAAFPIMAVVMGFNILKSPDRKAAMKEGLPKWLIGLALVVMLHVIMILILSINGLGINEAKRIGTELSGIDLTGEYYETRTSNDEGTEGKEITYVDENGNLRTKVKNTGKRQNEFSMYEEAVSKAYDVKFSSGFIGMCMYVLLTIYTYKFFFVYLKRFVNVITLTLIGPILMTVSTSQKIFNGSDNGMRKKWFKEYIYNVLIQTIHAIYYATLIGLSFKFSQTAETYIGSLLTLILFAFVFKIDAIIRKLFNVVGGSTSIKVFNTAGAVGTILGGGAKAQGSSPSAMGSQFGQDLSAGNQAKEGGLGETLSGGFAQFGQDIKSEFSRKGSNLAANIKQKAVNLKQLPNEVEKTLEGDYIKVSDEEIAKQQEILDENKGFEKIRSGVAFLTYQGLEGFNKLTIDFPQNAKASVKKQYQKAKDALQKKYQKTIDDYNNRILELNHNVRVLENTKAMINIFKTHRMPIMTTNPDYQDMYRAAIDTSPELQEIVNNMKDSIENGYSDLTAIAYENIGPQAFLYKKAGAPIAGLALLAESIYGDQVIKAIEDALVNIEKETKGVLSADRVLNAVDKTADALINLPETMQNAKRKVIEFPHRAVNKIKETKDAAITGAKKQVIKTVYKFERFSAKATSKIIGVAMKHYVMAEPYLKVISRVKGKIDAGVLTFRGAVNPQKTTIKYTGHVKARSKIQSKAKMKLVTFQQRRQDGAWAQAIAKSMDRHDNMRRQKEMASRAANINQSRLDVKIAQVQSLTAGQVRMATMIQNGTLVTLDDGNNLMKNVTPTSIIFSTVQDNIATKSDIINSIILANQTEGVVLQNIFGENKETALVNLIPQELLEAHPELQLLQQVGIVKENTIVQYVINENGEAVPQILTLDGQIIQPAVDEVGNPISFMQAVNENGEVQQGQIIQRILNMNGQVVEQIINLEQGFVIPQEQYQVQEIGLNTQNVLEQIQNLTYGDVLENVASLNARMEGLQEIVASTIFVNDIANAAAPEVPIYQYITQQAMTFNQPEVINQLNQINDFSLQVSLMQQIMLEPTAEMTELPPEEKYKIVATIINNMAIEDPSLNNIVAQMKEIVAVPLEKGTTTDVVEERLEKIEQVFASVLVQMPTITPITDVEPPKTVAEAYVVLESKIYQIQNRINLMSATSETEAKQAVQNIQSIIISPDTESFSSTILGRQVQKIQDIITPPTEAEVVPTAMQQLEDIKDVISETTKHVLSQMTPENIIFNDTIANVARAVKEETTVDGKVQSLENLVNDIPSENTFAQVTPENVVQVVQEATEENAFDNLLQDVKYQTLFDELKEAAEKTEETDMVLLEVSSELKTEAKYLDGNDNTIRELFTQSLINNGIVEEDDQSSIDDALAKMEERIANVPNDFTADRVAEEIFRKEAMGQDATADRAVLDKLLEERKDPLMRGVEALEKKVNEIGESISEKITDTKDSIDEKVTEVKDNINKAVSDTKEFVKENGVIATAFEASDRIDEGIEKLNNKIEDIADRIKGNKKSQTATQSTETQSSSSTSDEQNTSKKEQPASAEQVTQAEKNDNKSSKKKTTTKATATEQKIAKEIAEGEQSVSLIFRMNVEGGYQKVTGTTRWSFNEFIENAKLLDNSDEARLKREFADKAKAKLGIGNYYANKKVLITMNNWDFDVYPLADSKGGDTEEAKDKDTSQDKNKTLSKEELSLKKRIESYEGRFKNAILDFYRNNDFKNFKEGIEFNNRRKLRDIIVRGGFLESVGITKANIEYVLKNMKSFFGSRFIDEIEDICEDKHATDKEIDKQKSKFKVVSSEEVNETINEDVQDEDDGIIDLEREKLKRRTIYETSEEFEETGNAGPNIHVVRDEDDIQLQASLGVIESLKNMNERKIALTTNEEKRKQYDSQGKVLYMFNNDEINGIFRNAS